MTVMSWHRRVDPTAHERSAERAPDLPAGFASWVGPHVGRMGLLAVRLAPWADRDDLVQEALLRAWRSRSSFDPQRGEPGAWLLAILANVVRREGGRRGRTPAMVAVPDELPAAHPGGVGLEAAIDLERAVAALPARQRTAVDCFYFAGLNVAETAAVMGCSDGTVKSTLSLARARLRLLMEASDEHF